MNPFRQSPGLCGPASLKILMTYYGKDYSEEELTKLCFASAEKGTDHEDLVSAVEKLGHTPSVKSNASIEDLRKYISQNVPVIVGWWDVDDDHYSVVYDIDDKNIYLMDPELDEGKRIMPLEDWMKVWYDTDTELRTHVDRWMVAVPPS